MNPTHDEERSEIDRLLAASKPFSALPPTERALIAGALRLQRFRRGETVFCEGQAAAEAWLVYSGSVRILSYYDEARLMQIERLARGQLFGFYCRMGAGLRTHQCTAVVDGSLGAVRIPDELWKDCLKRFPEFSREACASCSVRLWHMRLQVASNKDSVERRVAGVLLRLYRTQGERVEATRQSLAIETGAALETVFRTLARFRRSGWVETGRSSVFVKNAAALVALLERPRPRARKL